MADYIFILICSVLGHNVVTTCFHYLLFILKLELAVRIHFNDGDLVFCRNELKRSVNRSMLLFATLPLANIIAALNLSHQMMKFNSRILISEDFFLHDCNWVW